MLWNLLVGVVVGAVAGHIMDTKGGILRNLILGLAGGFLGHFLAGLIGISASGIGSFLISIAGTCLLIFVARKLV